MRQPSRLPARTAAYLAAFLVLLAIGVDAVHLGAHGPHEPAPEEIFAEGGKDCHAREIHLHRGAPPRSNVCVACLWQGMGKTPPPDAISMPGAVEVSPVPAEAVASARHPGPLGVFARAPPSA